MATFILVAQEEFWSHLDNSFTPHIQILVLLSKYFHNPTTCNSLYHSNQHQLSPRFSSLLTGLCFHPCPTGLFSKSNQSYPLVSSAQNPPMISHLIHLWNQSSNIWDLDELVHSYPSDIISIILLQTLHANHTKQLLRKAKHSYTVVFALRITLSLEHFGGWTDSNLLKCYFIRGPSNVPYINFLHST